MNLRQAVEAYQDEMIESLRELIRIPSVKGEALPGKPFGEGADEALGYMLALSEKLGFATKNVDGYAGHAEYGEGEDYAGVLVHLDVVPVGDNWTHPPFGGVVEDGKIIGRGATDDKGPAIAALYCMKALKDCGITGSRRLRVIFGCDEESGMSDMEHYFKKEPLPVMGFLPDAEYPIFNREKGLLQLILHFESGESVVSSLSGGNAFNIVPDRCEAVLAGGNPGETEAGPCPVTATTLPDGKIKLTAMGKPAHASTPEAGRNACLWLLDLLKRRYGKAIGENLYALSTLFGTSYDGAGVGASCQDEPSGPLTLNVGRLELRDGKGTLWIDTRYPVTQKGEEITERIRKAVERPGVTLTVKGDMAPLYVPEDSPLIQKLSAAYERATGEPAKLCSMGGGTYARTLQNRGVAFGSTFRDHTLLGVHQADECVYIEDLMKHAVICAEAMAELMKD